MESLRFTKTHGAGNSYIKTNVSVDCPANLSELAVKMSNGLKRTWSDGLIVIPFPAVVDSKISMFNSYGAAGKMCVNTSRYIGRYVYEKRLTDKKAISFIALSGIKILSFTTDSGYATFVSPGRTLHMQRKEYKNHLYMSGETVSVFEGEYLIEP